MSQTRKQSGTDGRQAWSFRVATIVGIPIRIHFTFILFLAWIGLSGGSSGGASMSILVAAIFVCVLLHELGHALVAKKLGVLTRDITLYPIGGVAMLDSKPTPPQELKISLAGPAVNLVLAVLFFVYTQATHSLVPVKGGLQSVSLPQALLIANLTLAVFNMIPAFPMDGGRVLRAALGLRLSEARSTQIAGGIGQALAVMLGIVGLFTQGYVLMLIAFFVFVGASQEIQATVARSILHGHILSDVMQTSFETIASGASLQSAANRVIHGTQRDFPVTNGDEVLGILTRSQLALGLATDGETAYVAGWMERKFKSANAEMPLEEAVELFTQSDTAPVLVFEEERLIGMASLENISQFVMLEHAKSRGHAGPG